jgi:hypothetical protein
MFVRMLENRRVGGVIYTKDTVYDVADELGALLVGGGWAVRTDSPQLWMNRPASGNPGVERFFSDIGNGQVPFYWTGARWQAGGAYVLAASGTAVVTGATTAEVQVAAIPIPGGLLGPNSVIQVKSLWTSTGTAGTKLSKVRFVSAAGSPFWEWGPGSTAAVWENITSIRNAGSLTAQVAYFQGTSSGTGTVGGLGQASAAVNTAADQVLEIVAQKGNAADGLTMFGYSVEILPF